jgi:hypothetical protein
MKSYRVSKRVGIVLESWPKNILFAKQDNDGIAELEMDEKDRQVNPIQRRFSKEKEELSKKCLSVAFCGIYWPC